MKINFFAPINNLGYGIHSYNTIRAFEDRGHQVTLIPPFGQVSRTDAWVERWLERREHFDPNAPGVMIFNEEFLTQFTGKPRIGFPVFECEKFTPLQIACMKSCDYIFTPTAWAADILRKSGIGNVRIVNEGFDPQIFKDSDTSESEIQQMPFTFVHVGKFEERKGTLQLIECFFKALEHETARLLLHIHNPFIETYLPIDEILERLGFISTNNGLTWRRMGLSIHFTQPFSKTEDLAALYKVADCGLYPTRAEGWGLPILETLVTGVPVIAGYWTGQTEYMSALGDYPFYIDKFRKEMARDNMWFQGGRGHWNVPESSDLIHKIKLAFKTAREYRKTDSWKEKVSRVRNFTWASAGAQLETALKDICGL